MDDLSFQKATDSDLDAVLDIYNFYIETTTATFDCGPVSKEEFLGRNIMDHEKYRVYLITQENILAGFYFLTQFRKKKAYDRTAEAGIYLKPEYTGRGIGKESVAFLEEEARKRGIKVLIASISNENTASIKLVREMGYEKCAHYKQVGEKFGRVLDVVEFQKILTG